MDPNKIICMKPSYLISEEKECANYIICSNLIENDQDICHDCHCLFGKWRDNLVDDGILKIIESYDKCKICDEEDRENKFVMRPNCSHYICTRCFRKLYYGKEDEKPTFPYKNMEDKYWNNIDSQIEEEWMKEDVIIQYIIKLNYWYNYQGKMIDKTNKCLECI